MLSIQLYRQSHFQARLWGCCLVHVIGSCRKVTSRLTFKQQTTLVWKVIKNTLFFWLSSLINYCSKKQSFPCRCHCWHLEPAQMIVLHKAKYQWKCCPSALWSFRLFQKCKTAKIRNQEAPEGFLHFRWSCELIVKLPSYCSLFGFSCSKMTKRWRIFKGVSLWLCRALPQGTDPHRGELGASCGRRHTSPPCYLQVLHLSAQTNLLVCDGIEEQPRSPELE